MPTAEQVERAAQLIARGPSQHDYFFDNLDNPEWIEPLRERGFFSSPPPPEVSEEGELHPRWPESQFLLRVVDRVPAEVAAVVVDIPSTDNVRVMTDICRIGVALPPELRLEVGKLVRARTAERQPLFFVLPEAMADLIVALADAGEVKFALNFASELLAVREPKDKSALRPRAYGRMGIWEYGRVTRRLVPDLARTAGLDAVELAADLLEQMIELTHLGKPPRDHAEYWRPAIEEHGENRTDEMAQAIVSALRDAALQLVDREPSQLGAVVAALRKRPWRLFSRIALYVLAERASADLELARALALDRDIVAEADFEREHDQLVAAVFPLLSQEDRDVYLARIEGGPKITRSGDPELDRRTVEYWQRDRLAPLVEHLPPEWQARLEDLTERYGKPQVGRFRLSSGTWVGPTSPLTKEEMASMSAEAAVDYLAQWKPSDAPMTPTPEGLARVLSSRVEEAPAEFTAVTDRIAELDPTYVRAVLHGLDQALQKDREFSWEQALALVEKAVESPALELPADERERRDRDPDWRWARKDAASLLETALRGEALPLELGSRVWESLEQLSWDPEPDLDYERQYGGSNMDPLTLSLNTVRGQAMHAMMAFAVWAKKQEANDLLRAALANLKAHLDPAREPSETVRGVFGARLHQLHWVDPEWLREEIPAIFPRQSGLERLRIAAWDTYLVWGRPSLKLYDALKDEYSAAVDELPISSEREESARKNPGQALAEHIATFLWWGIFESADGGLPARFFAAAEPEDASHLLHVLGRSLADEQNHPIDPEVLRRLERLWAELPEWIAARPVAEQRTILGGFGDWYAAGVLDEDWADEQLLRLAGNGVLAGPEFIVFRRLVARARTAPEPALRFALAFVANPPEVWAIDAQETEFQAIIEAGLESDQLERELATRLVNQLVAKGQRQYRSYIDREENSHMTR